MSRPASGLRDHVGYWLRRLSDEVHLSFERKLATHGVTVAQWNVLVTLYRDEGTTVAEVARFIETDAAAVSRLVDRLVEKGLVNRSADPASRRRVLLTLTQPASQLVPVLAGLADQNDAEFFRTLSATKRAELAGLLQRLTADARTVTHMNSHPQEGEPIMTAATENLQSAQARAMSIRPKAGGFPVLAKVLHEAGVHRNEWFLPAAQSVYLTDLGPVVQQGPPIATGLLDVPPFDRDAVIRAIRADQAGTSTFPEFLEAAWRAGVLRYVADFDEREVTYYGWNGENYVESYPDPAIEQP